MYARDLKNNFSLTKRNFPFFRMERSFQIKIFEYNPQHQPGKEKLKEGGLKSNLVNASNSRCEVHGGGTEGWKLGGWVSIYKTEEEN